MQQIKPPPILQIEHLQYIVAKSIDMKKTTVLIAALGCMYQAQAQFEISTGIGLALSASKTQHFLVTSTKYYSSQIDTSYYSYKVSGEGFGVFVYPKFHVFEMAKHSLSIGAPIMLGLSGSANSQEGGTMSFLYDFNLSADINGGRLNKKSGDSKEKFFGYFVGVGLGIINTSGKVYDLDGSTKQKDNSVNYTVVSDNDNIEDHMSVKTAGFFIHAGGTLPIGYKNGGSSNVGVRLFFKPGFGDKSPSYFGINGFITLGKYTENYSRSRSKSGSKSNSRSRSSSSRHR